MKAAIALSMLVSMAGTSSSAVPPEARGTPGRKSERPGRPLPDWGYGDPDGPHGGTWDYPTAVPQDSVPGRYQFFSYDYNGDGIPDIVLIKRNGTGSGSTELHVLNGATNYTTYLQQTGTGYAESDANTEFAMADWDFDGIPDLFVIIKQATGSGTTEVHVLSGASNYQSFILHSTSGLGLTTDQWTFKIADWDRDGYPDLIGIAKYATGTNSTEVHILSGAPDFVSGQVFQNFILHTGTPLGVTDANFDFTVIDYNGDGYPDLEAISKAGYGTNSTEVHILDGASGFTRFLVEDGTSLYMHPNDASIQSFFLPLPRVAQVRFWGNDPDWRMHVFVSAEPILYHGGSGVMGGIDSIYYIYYGNVPAATRTAMEDFARGIGNTLYYGIDTQYNSGNTYITNSVAYGGSTAPGYTHGTILNDNLISTIVNEALNSGALARNSQGVYFVITAPDVMENDACNTKHFCGFHSATANAFVDIKYAWVGDPRGCAQTLCSLSTQLAPTPNDLNLDAMISITAHEFSESVTDPHGNTWYDAHGNEVADKCAWRFGPMSVNLAGANYNLRLATGDFIVQQNWHLNDFGYCTMRQ